MYEGNLSSLDDFLYCEFVTRVGVFQMLIHDQFRPECDFPRGPLHRDGIDI